MKLLLYSHFFAPSVGGVETIVLALARGLSASLSATGSHLFEVTVVTNTARGQFDDASVPFRVVRQPKSSELLRMVREADLLHVAGPSLAPISWGLFFRKPVVVEHSSFQAICPTGQLFQEPQNIPCPGHFMAGKHGNCLRCSGSPQPIRSFLLWILAFVRRYQCRRVAGNLVPTAWLDSLLRLPRTEAVPHGLEPGAAIVPVASLTEPPLLLFVGRLVSTKGVAVLLQAAQLLAGEGVKFRLVIAGDGPERTVLEKQAAEMSAPVQFVGRLDDRALQGYFAQASVVVVPSLAGEVFGLVILENMFRGLPVVASDLGSFKEVLGDAGRTFAVGSAAALAQQIRELLLHRKEAAALGVAARQRALDFFTVQRMIDAHAKLYCRLMDKEAARTYK